MIVFPALDLRGGRVVRLLEGNPDKQTVFSDNPVQTAQQWLDEGATWLHMVNLDGAFSQANDNLHILEQTAKLAANIQFGGGIRSMADIERVLSAGAKRVILGTVAVKNPQLVQEALERFGPETICVALDARNGYVTTHGWTTATEVTPTDLGEVLAKHGLRYALYTDVNRDGRLLGVDVHNTIMLGVHTGLSVIASGGVGSIDEIHRLAQSGRVYGVIIGMALYMGLISLKEALQAAKTPPTTYDQLLTNNS